MTAVDALWPLQLSSEHSGSVRQSGCKFHSNLHQHPVRTGMLHGASAACCISADALARKWICWKPTLRDSKTTRTTPARCSGTPTGAVSLQSTKFLLQPRDSAPDYHSRGVCEL